MSIERRSLEIRRLGRTRYEDAHRLQQELLVERIEGRVGDLLLFTEHEPVVTLGRGSPVGDAAGVALPIVHVERGGEATWHGPGQIVGYPIVSLPEERRDLHRYLRDLEQVVIDTLATYAVVGRREEGLTGVWIGARKVASIGVAVRRWVAWHGFALNVTNDESSFRGFQPCGLDPGVMTRLADHVPEAPSIAAVEDRLALNFERVFGYVEVVDARGR